MMGLTQGEGVMVCVDVVGRCGVASGGVGGVLGGGVVGVWGGVSSAFRCVGEFSVGEDVAKVLGSAVGDSEFTNWNWEALMVR